MNTEEIENILNKYDELLEITYNVIHSLEKINFDKYNTARGIEEINFDSFKKIIYVTCDDTFRGIYDTIHFSFPMEWLTKSELELTKLVTEELKLEEEAYKIKLAQQLEKENKLKEEKDLADYNRLKAKFEK